MNTTARMITKNSDTVQNIAARTELNKRFDGDSVFKEGGCTDHTDRVGLGRVCMPCTNARHAPDTS